MKHTKLVTTFCYVIIIRVLMLHEEHMNLKMHRNLYDNMNLSMHSNLDINVVYLSIHLNLNVNTTLRIHKTLFTWISLSPQTLDDC
jgi:hypothetical protein